MATVGKLSLVRRLLSRDQRQRRAERATGERTGFFRGERANGIGFVSDLSRTGVYVRSSYAPMPGEALELSLVGLDGDLFELAGTVARVGQDGFALRLERGHPELERLLEAAQRD